MFNTDWQVYGYGRSWKKSKIYQSQCRDPFINKWELYNPYIALKFDLHENILKSRSFLYTERTSSIVNTNLYLLTNKVRKVLP
jgi:hypothetical protein